MKKAMESAIGKEEQKEKVHLPDGIRSKLEMVERAAQQNIYHLQQMKYRDTYKTPSSWEGAWIRNKAVLTISLSPKRFLHVVDTMSLDESTPDNRNAGCPVKLQSLWTFAAELTDNRSVRCMVCKS